MSRTSSALETALARSSRLVALTGAGVSAESGVPTFRGAGGLWNGHDARSLATPEAFASDPVLVWEFYDARRVALLECAPNAAHRALAGPDGLRSTVVTQNVDGLHQAAGGRQVIELHGNIWSLRCALGCGEREDRTAPLPRPLPPRCACGAALRPGVVWFGESLPFDAFSSAARAVEQAEFLLVIGTSGSVEPAASLARLAHRAGVRVIEINPEPTPLSAVADAVIREPAALAVPRLLDREAA